MNIRFDMSGIVSPAKSDCSIPSLNSSNEDSSDLRFNSLFSSNITAKAKMYELATHSVSVRRSGVIGDVADIWKAQGVNDGRQVPKSHLNRLKSIKALVFTTTFLSLKSHFWTKKKFLFPKGNLNLIRLPKLRVWKTDKGIWQEELCQRNAWRLAILCAGEEIRGKFETGLPLGHHRTGSKLKIGEGRCEVCIGSFDSKPWPSKPWSSKPFFKLGADSMQLKDIFKY